MTDSIPIRRALISVSDKIGLLPFAQALASNGVEILSTGGSARALREAGVPVTEVSDHTGFPEILDGRVKTLVPQIHGGILGRRDDPAHLAQMQRHNIAPIDLVAVNLYPFEATVAQGAPDDTCVENIDIGGPALIRAAAKNHDFVTVLTDPAQYPEVIAALTRDGGTTLALRRRLAGEAYARTAAYDAAIAAWFAERRGDMFPQRLAIAGSRRQTLRYGENPHQSAAFYATGNRPGIATARQIGGKELSYNNLNDTDAAFECVAEFDAPTVAIIKHANPCGVASAATLAEAWDLAFLCDPVSPFGGIVALNRPLDLPAAEKIAAILTEVIIAPDADEAAKAAVARRKNLRLLLTGGMPEPLAPGLTFRSIVRWLPGTDPRQRPHNAERPEGGDAPGAHRGGTRGPAVRLQGLQACEVQRHRVCERWRHRRHRCRSAQPGGQRPDRRLEGRGSRQGCWPGCPVDSRQRGRLRRLLPLRRRSGGHDRRRCHGGDPARRLDPRRRGDRRRRRRRCRHGVHGHAALSALGKLGRHPQGNRI